MSPSAAPAPTVTLSPLKSTLFIRRVSMTTAVLWEKPS